nr:S41 family peptidase [Acidisarcina polymorpha]
MPFKDNKRAVLVGETSAGSSGQPITFHFNADQSVAVSAKTVYFPNGSLFERVGITPDVEASPSLEDLKAGRDTILDRAIALARTAKP